MDSDDFLDAPAHSPLRARRRQSDAKWRASVATCYEALRHVVPDSRSQTRKKVSKALILEESQKHILDLESTIDDIIKEKCPSEGKVMLWKDNNLNNSRWTKCTLDHFRQDFANQQQKIFHRTFQSRRCYSLLRDIQDEVFGMAPNSTDLSVVDEQDLPSFVFEDEHALSSQREAGEQVLPFIGRNEEQAQPFVDYLLDEEALQGLPSVNEEALNLKNADGQALPCFGDEDEHAMMPCFADMDGDGTVYNQRTHQTSSFPQSSSGIFTFGDNRVSLETPPHNNDYNAMTSDVKKVDTKAKTPRVEVRYFRIVASRPKVSSSDVNKEAAQIVPSSESKSNVESSSKRESPSVGTHHDAQTMAISRKVPPTLLSLAPSTRCRSNSDDLPCDEMTLTLKEDDDGKSFQTVPSLLDCFQGDIIDDDPDDDSVPSLWHYQDTDKVGEGGRCLKPQVHQHAMSSVSPVIHVPLLDDNGTGVKVVKTDQCTVTVKEEFGDVWNALDFIKTESTPANGGGRDTYSSHTDGVKRKVSPRIQEDEVRTTPKCRKKLDTVYDYQHLESPFPDCGLANVLDGDNDKDDDSQVVPGTEGKHDDSHVTDSGTCINGRREAQGNTNIETLIPSDLMLSQETPADYDGFSYYYRQVSNKMRHSQSPVASLSNPEMAAKVAHMWTKLSDHDKHTVQMLATIETSSPANRNWNSLGLGGLSQDLQEVEVKPLLESPFKDPNALH